ncbi:hypothetical protein O3P69_020182 [Scylla paramamosain]|uniref:Uncharacterized protein n=1 Tax=Scylla paramamosain TaxID=85552 RepID=A0AAW0TN79_SCYPA
MQPGQYGRRATSLAPDDLSGQPVGEPYAQDTMTTPMGPVPYMGQAGTDGSLQRGEPGPCEPPLGRMRSPEPASVEESRSQAREELSRRLTHLTRLSGGSGMGSWIHNPHKEGEQRPYRRTSTTGRLTGEATGPPVYRRTNTMDLPPADARARPGSDYRRHLQQDPARRYSAASRGRGAPRGRVFIHETLVEGQPLVNPSPNPHTRLVPQHPQPHPNPTRFSHPTPYSPPSHINSPSSTSSSSSHLTSPSSSSSSYRSSGPYSPPSSAFDSARYNSPVGRKSSFYRY